MGRLGQLIGILLASTAAMGQPVGPSLSGAMRWRMIGPFRGGRTVAAVGVPGQLSTFYIGVNNGGVWKTTDAGRIWTPIFDDQPTGSIGAIAVAPSDPSTIYVGTGEGLQRPDLSTGDGVYKSTDGGKTWQHLGLRDGQQIAQIVVDPADANRLFVAVMGHPYGANQERGIFRSIDGGRSFQKVLYRDDNTCGMDVAFDPSNAQTLYADLWQAQQGPWENAYFTGPGSALYKSTNGGTTWRQLTRGLPGAADGLGRIGIEVSRSDPKRLYANVDATKLGGVYRSDDGGESWQLMNADNRLWGRGGDFNEVRCDPKNAEVVYVANVVSWKSTDGGKTFRAFRGAPGGDDYHRIWINPDDTRVMLIASDQGAIITVNGGESWSSWYNQPTAQFYHVTTDNSFPYRVCGGQQESGSACVESRSDDGQITFRDWRPVGIEEYGYAVPDPLDPDIIYGGKLERFDRRTKQVMNVAPKTTRDDNYRVLRTQPVVFSPVDPHILYFASNTLWKTTDGGRSWTSISPDLTRKEWALPPSVGVYATSEEARPKQRGVIYAVAPSPLDGGRIWAGTDDGLIHVTVDGGGSWKNVTPSELRPFAKVSIMEASHFDAMTAYAAINTFRLDDLRPHIDRTRDGGTSWTHITNGIPDGGSVNVVREDPKRKGVLFAGTEQAVYVSFDDGDHWQSLRLNMPATSIRDLVIHDDDVVVGTHGRGFWILDDIEPLRQFDATGTDATLFRPARAWRFRWSKYPDTPLPPDEPAGQNPPDGAIIDYSLKTAASGPVTIEILDASGNLVRRYASSGSGPAAGEPPRRTGAKPPAEKSETRAPVEEKGGVPETAAPPKDEGQVPGYWIRPPQTLSGAAGMHRFVWDLHYTPVPGLRVTYPISAIPHDTAPAPTSPWVMPGDYVVRLTVNGKSYTQPLTVAIDPRVETSTAGLMQQFTVSRQVYDDLMQVQAAIEGIDSMRKRTPKPAAALDLKLAALRGDTLEPGEGPVAGQENTLSGLSGSLRNLLTLLESADLAPTTQAIAAANEKHVAVGEVLKQWRAVSVNVR
jgi:photosystem II stability/assembly factor-like uncharacterized protein